MKFSSQPLPVKRSKTEHQQVLPSTLNFHSLHISSSAPMNDKGSNGSRDTKIQIQDIQRHTDHLLFKEQSESPLLFVSQKELEQTVPYSKLQKAIPLSSIKKADAAQDPGTQTDTVQENFICSKFKNGHPASYKAAVTSPDIINKIPCLVLTSETENCQFSPWSSNTNEILLKIVNIMNNQVMPTNALEQKEQLSFSPLVAKNIKVSQDLLKQFPLGNHMRRNNCFVTNNHHFYQVHESTALKGNYSENETIILEDVANNKPNIKGKTEDYDSCRDHSENDQSTQQSSNTENEFVNGKCNHDLSESKNLLLNEPMSGSYEKVLRKQHFSSPLNPVGDIFGTVATTDASAFSPPPILPLGFVENAKPDVYVKTCEENIQQSKNKMKAINGHLRDKDDELYEPNQNFQELETISQESNKVSEESYYDLSQKTNGDFQRSDDSFPKSNKSIISTCDTDETLHVSDEFLQESDESSQESVQYSYDYTEYYQDADEPLQELDENFQLLEEMPNCNVCSQGSIGDIITFSPLTGTEDNKPVSKCPLSGTLESSPTSCPTNVSGSPFKGCTKECRQVGNIFHDYDLKGQSLKVSTPNVLWCNEKTEKVQDIRAESLGELRGEDDLCTLGKHDNFEVPYDMKMNEGGFCKEIYANLKDESKTLNTMSHRSLERNIVQYDDSSLLRNETSDEGISSLHTDLRKPDNERNLDDNVNKEETAPKSKNCCLRDEATSNFISNNEKDNSFSIPCINEKITSKAKTCSSYHKIPNTTQEHQMNLEESNISHSRKHSNSKVNILKSSENHQFCLAPLNCKEWPLNKFIVQPLKSSSCKECTDENCFINHDITTEQVVPDNESVPCKCSLGSNEDILGDFQFEEMSKLQHNSSSCSAYTWTPLIPILNNSISQTSNLHVSDPCVVTSSLNPPFNKKRSIRVGLSRRQKVKRLHVHIRH